MIRNIVKVNTKHNTFGVPSITAFKSCFTFFSQSVLISLILQDSYPLDFTDVESMLSNPLIMSSTEATVHTLDAIMPTVSNELAKGINPYLDTRPYVGLRPTIPQNEAGNRTEPPVSEPRELK